MSKETTSREKINCSKDFGVNHAKFDLIVKILKWAEGSLGWSTETTKDIIGGLAQLMVAELALCETYKTSSQVDFPSDKYVDAQMKILTWFAEFIKAVKPLADKPAANANASDAAKSEQSKKAAESNVAKLISDLANLVVPPQSAKAAFDKKVADVKSKAKVNLNAPEYSLETVLPGLDLPNDNASDPQVSVLADIYHQLQE